ncbi:MAG: hypothetical protein JW965_04990 [Bacteroidales bacterium]|nr:hypothetical protein [Bacteroidales bacterium]
MENSTNNNIKPSFGRSFSQGLEILGDNFLPLLLVIIVVVFIQIPVQIVRFTAEIGGIGLFLVGFGIFALAYSFLVIPVFDFGSDLIFIHAARKQKIDFKYLVSGFSENYVHIILANLLVFALVMIGIIMLIIPGIIIGVRLTFVSYLVMDKKMDPITAVEESWRLTKGYGWTIFAMGLVSFFIIIFGFLMLIIGIFPAIMWVSGAFASIYNDVLTEKGELPEIPESE